MGNFKVRVNNDNASEVIDLLVSLGHKTIRSKEGLLSEISSGSNQVVDTGEGLFTTANVYDVKEITLPELRAMVNNQHAEIEKVRQAEIHGTVKAESAWDTQIGGIHYKQFKIQPMQFALENKLDAAQQNVIKYIMRHSFKNGKQDLEKAKHYIDLMIEFYYGDPNHIDS